MKKIFYILLCLILFVGCDNVVLRKDKSERITFEKKVPQGEYTLYMYEIKYPEKQEEKIAFMSKFENFLRNKVEGINRDVNFIMPENLYEDINYILNDEGIGIERAFFKSSSFVGEEDKKIIDRETSFVKTPLNGGEIQKYLNKQYFYILSLVGKQKEYDENFFYTEYDKRTIISEYIEKRESLKEILSEKKKDFLVAVENKDFLEKYKDDMLYLKEHDEDLEEEIINRSFSVKSPLVVMDSYSYNGYTVCGNSIIFLAGDKENNENINYFRRYKFNVVIKEISDFNYSNFALDENQLEVSVLLGRKKFVPRRPLGDF